MLTYADAAGRERGLLEEFGNSVSSSMSGLSSHAQGWSVRLGPFLSADKQPQQQEQHPLTPPSSTSPEGGMGYGMWGPSEATAAAVKSPVAREGLKQQEQQQKQQEREAQQQQQARDASSSDPLAAVQARPAAPLPAATMPAATNPGTQFTCFTSTKYKY